MEPLRGSSETSWGPHRATDMEPLTGFTWDRGNRNLQTGNPWRDSTGTANYRVFANPRGCISAGCLIFSHFVYIMMNTLKKYHHTKTNPDYGEKRNPKRRRHHSREHKNGRKTSWTMRQRVLGTARKRKENWALKTFGVNMVNRVYP